MKSLLIHFVIIGTFLGLAQDVSAARGIPQNNYRLGLFASRLKFPQGVRMTGKPGFGAKPAGAWLQAAGAAKPQPLSKQQLLELIAGGVPTQRAAELVRDRGIDFQVDDDYVRTLRQAGANDHLIDGVTQGKRGNGRRPGGNRARRAGFPGMEISRVKRTRKAC